MSVVSNTTTVTISAASVLSNAAASLTSGQSSSFPSIHPSLNVTDIQWQTAFVFYGSGIAQIMGKHTSADHNFRHYIYTESSNSWVRTTESSFDAGSTSGHAWTQCVAPNGDHYFKLYQQTKLWRRVYSSGTWVATATDATRLNALNLTGGPIGWHPNLFGTGQGGVVHWAVNYIAAYNPSTDAWSTLLGPLGSSHPLFARSGGGDSHYFSDTDTLIMGTGKNNTTAVSFRIVTIAAGGGVTWTTNSLPSSMEVYGAGGHNNSVTNIGKIIVHPSQPTRLLLLEYSGVPSTNSRVWQSTDRGDSWTLLGYSHPFNSMTGASQGFICGSLPNYGVVWGITSASGGGQSVLWKPA